jgi:hypothetical protein
VTSKLPIVVWYESDTSSQYQYREQIAIDDPDLSYVIEKFSYDNGTQPTLYRNGAGPEIPLVSISC